MQEPKEQFQLVESRLRQTAFKSFHHKYYHAACIVDLKGNTYSYKENYSGKNFHAEIRAYEHFIKVYQPRGIELDYILVARFNRQGQIRFSKPCKNCIQYFKNKDITIFYSV